MDGPPQFGTGGPPTAAAPDWYPDPERPGGYRYWDGARWTEYRSTPPPPPQDVRTDGFAIASLVLGVFGGMVLAIIFGFVARSRIKRSGGAKRGKGLATAGIVLGGIWSVLIGAAIVLAVTGELDHTNTDRYATGEERAIAEVIDDLERAFKDKDVDLACNQLFTVELRDLLDSGDGCDKVVRTEGYQPELKIKELEIQGAEARALISEFGTGLVVSLLEVGGEWRIDGIS